MSQEKMDKYKEYKKNRKEILEKEKKSEQRRKMFGWAFTGLLALALVVALGITAKNAIQDHKNALPVYDRNEAVIYDVAGILDEETEESSEAAAESSEAPAESSTAA